MLYDFLTEALALRETGVLAGDPGKSGLGKSSLQRALQNTLNPADLNPLGAVRPSAERAGIGRILTTLDVSFGGGPRTADPGIDNHNHPTEARSAISAMFVGVESLRLAPLAPE